ncbi:mediator of RNA polymerase II transcription subunit 15a [Dendrobium catenatum]|uniref:mediator of RNA polymerase II transcription subunit 15a n=1 Tax=Dendrobium catenatum TaxID=906689 RepID=UPI00109FA76E|nr:mediator of RNA polymerase II transcription subunit 15a [Dendrobium catenatum]
MQGSSSLSAAPSITGLSQSTITNFGHTSNMQNMPGISHSSVNNSLAQGTTADIYANAPRHMQGRQQQQSQNPLIYQNSLQPQLMKKMHNNALLQSSMQQQQQQQSLLQTNQLQTSQQSTMQMPSGLTSGQSSIQQPPATSIQSASQPALQQNQLNAIQQSVSPLLPQHVQAFPRQSQQPQSSLHQQTNLQTQQQQQQQQQQQLIGQQANMSNIQQNQLLGQQNSIVDIKQQQQRLPVQQNNLINMQQSQQLLNQQSLSLHQQQLGQQTNMQGLQQQQQPQSQQQQQLLGSLQNISNMQSHQRSMQLLQQSKNMSQAQQQLQQPSISLLQPQGQQALHLSSQQHLMSQFQPQGQLQQPLAMQQHSNGGMQREMQQRISSGTLLQPQSALEQQKQFMQSQRGIPEVSSSTSMDSTAQTGHNGADWQEEVYQKIQVMKESHLAELQEFHLKISQRYQQSEMMPQAKQSGNFEKLKSFKVLLERVLAFLQISKNSITIGLKEKLPTYEKQILGLLNTNNKQKIMPSQLQGQQQQLHHPGGLAQSTPQHQPSQVLQVQQHENLGNQVHQMNVAGSITSMQSAVTSSMQHGSMTLPSLVAPLTQQNATNSAQSAPDLDPVQVNSFGSLQQGTMGSLQQSGVGPLPNSVGASQQTNLNNLSQSSLSSLQPNGTSVQNSNVLQQQHLKQQQQEHLLQNQQQLKQQLQQRQMQQQLLQQQQRLQQPLQQHVHLQQKQQQPSQLPVHQMSQLHPMNELNELKARQGSSIKPGIYQQTFTGVQRPNYYTQQLKPGASFPISSPQSLQASSPQISHHSSPQIEHALLPTHAKPGTPMQSTGSPFVVPSPSPSTPIAPSPIPGDSEKLLSAAVSLPTTGQATNQQAASAPLQSQSISVATPGISASPLLAEFPSQEGNLTNATSRVGASERPLERLIKAVQSMSPTALSSAVSDISSVVSMIDRIAGSAPGNGSRAAVGEDLVAMTKCRLQARNFMSQDGGTTTKKMKRHTSAMPLNNVSSAGSVNDNFMKFGSLDSPELESTATSHVKRRKLEVNHALQEEIREINQQLIDTVVSICDEDSDSAAAAASEGVGEGTIIECSFNGVAFSPSLKAHFASMHMRPIAPLRLLVPSNYPKCSPLLLDKLPIESSKEFEDLSIKAKSRFSISLRGLSQPMSLGEMAGTWDSCARKVIVEYVQKTGGGSFSSTYGAWVNCVGA